MYKRQDHWYLDYATGTLDEYIEVDLGSIINDIDLWTVFVIEIIVHSSNGTLKITKSTGGYTSGKERNDAIVLDLSATGIGFDPGGGEWFKWTPRNYKFPWHHQPDTIDSTVVWIGWDEFRFGGINEGTDYADVHPFEHVEP